MVDKGLMIWWNYQELFEPDQMNHYYYKQFIQGEQGISQKSI